MIVPFSEMRLFTLLSALVSSSVVTEDIPPEPRDDLALDAPLEIEVLVPPPESCERRVSPIDSVVVNYTVWRLSTGNKVSSSKDNTFPLTINLGRAEVFPGWEEGMTGACVGERRRLIVPAGKAFGTEGLPSTIPGNATLVVNVELLSINKQEEL